MRTDHLEFVERNELKRWVEDWQKKTRRLCPLRTAKSIPVRTLYEFLEALPIAKADLLRKYGTWIGVSPMVDSMQCSECGYQIQSEELETPYCPNCGARMEREE